jgi:hypothetical protein
LLKEKDNQVDMARARLTAMQAHHSTSEGALTSLEDAISDKDKQIAQIKEQRDRAEQERNEERDLHERQIAEYKMKAHSVENEMEKLQVNNGFILFVFFDCLFRVNINISHSLDLIIIEIIVNSIFKSLFYQKVFITNFKMKN